MKQKIDLSEGFSLYYLVHAFFVIIAGIALFAFHFLFAIFVLFIGVILLFARTGVLIDLDNKKATVYRSILGYKFGKTIDLQEFNYVRLKYTNESTIMQSRSAINTIRTKTYTLFLSSGINPEVLLYDFTSYMLAQKAFSTLKEQLAYDGYDEVAEAK